MSCVCAPLCSPHLVLSHSYTALSLCLVSILIVKLSRKYSALSYTHSLSLCHSASVTSRHPHKFIEWELFSLDIKICVYFLLCCTHTHSLTPFITPPSAAAAAYKLLLFLLSSAVCAHDASSRRRCLLAHVLRLLCVCVRCRRRCRCRCVFFVVASSSSSSRACCCCMQGRLRTNFNIIWRSSFAHSVAAFALSLAVCVFSHSFALSLSLACFACSLLFDFSCRLASWVRVDVPAKNKWCALVEAEQHVWNEYN